MPGTVLKPTKIGTDLPGGVLLDKANDLLLIDQTTDDIYLYSPPYNAPPFATISLKGLAGPAPSVRAKNNSTAWIINTEPSTCTLILRGPISTVTPTASKQAKVP